MMSSMTKPTGDRALSSSKWKCCVPAAANSENCLPVVQFVLRAEEAVSPTLPESRLF